MATPPPVTLTFQMSDAFITEVTGQQGGQTGSNYTGVWAYLWNKSPPSGEQSFTTVIDGGQLQNGIYDTTTHTYTVTLDLTNATTTTADGSVLYLLVQSEPLTNPGTSEHTNDLKTLITDEGKIEGGVKDWQYGYAQFEYSLLGEGGDAGDLTAIPGFAFNTQLEVTYTGGAKQYRGYGETQETVFSKLGNGPTHPNVLTYDGGELAGKNMMAISPSNAPMQGGEYYPPSDWADYVTEGFAVQRDLLLSGATNGEPDANGVWHNGQYYSYKIQSVHLDAGTWGGAGQYFVFSPKEGSQTKAWMVISEADLQSNLYSAGQGKAYIYEDPYLTKPYTVPGSGSPVGSADAIFVLPGSTNDQFGNVFTQAFTGFTAGYWATVATQSNPYNQGTYGSSNWAAQNINLNNNANWDPAYAFDNYRDEALSPKPSYIHYDAYSEYFFYNSNVYGSAFSDNLSVGITPGPLIPLGQPGVSGIAPANNVDNINLYVYGSQEIAPNYTKPVGGPFFKPASTQTDYLIPDTTSALNMKVVGRDASVLLRQDLTVQLGIYKGKDANGHGQFDYVTLPTGGNLWQTYTFSGTTGDWTVTVNPNTLGTFFITGLPVASTVAAGDIGWYQLVLSDLEGRQKVYEFYTTAASNTAGDIGDTVFDVAVTGGAIINLTTLASDLIELDLHEYQTAPVEMLTFAYAGGASLNQAAAAPVAGTLSGGTFTALDDQNGTGLPTQGNVPATSAPSVTVTGETPLAFGWTGTNNGTHSGPATNPTTTPTGGVVTWGLISEYTNQIVPGHIAQVNITQTAGGTFSGVLEATPDLDGRWQTTTTATLGNGTYTVVMQELEGDGVTLYGPASVALTLTVTGAAATGAVNATAAEISADLDTYGANLPTSITISDNEALTVTVGQITGDADVLAMLSSDYKLIVQDRAGNVAAALNTLSGNTHLQEIEFTDTGASILSFDYADYHSYSGAIDKMVGAHSLLLTNVTGKAYSSMLYDYNDRHELTAKEYFHTGITGQNYTGYQVVKDASDRLLSETFTGVTGQPFYAYEKDYAAGYATTLPNNGLIGTKHFYANVQGQAYTNYEHDRDENGHTTRIYVSGVKNQPYSSYEYDYIINSTGSHHVGTKTYYTDIVGTSYTGNEVHRDASGHMIKLVVTGGQITDTRVFSSWEYDYANGDNVLTGMKYYQTDITGQDYTGYVVELNASSQKIAETWTGYIDKDYSALKHEYANGDGVVTGYSKYITNVQNYEYSSYQIDYVVEGTSQLQSQAIYNNNDGSHQIRGWLSTPQTLDSIFDDVMTGDSGADTFSFTPFFGQATITDFTPADGDKISLPSSEFANFAYVNDPAHKSVADGNTVITGSNGDTVTLKGFVGTLQESDFLFA